MSVSKDMYIYRKKSYIKSYKTLNTFSFIKFYAKENLLHIV